jgi:tyrosine-protein kinase Etk/Wzc
VIPCGPIPPNPAELLLDPRLNELMEEVKNNFDMVIMDTAPIGLVGDAINLTRFADCSVYIVRHSYTFRRMLGLIDELYTLKKLPALSLLLNDVKLGGGYGGYYGGYGYLTSYGYGDKDSYYERERPFGKATPFRRLARWWKRQFS